MDRSCWTRRGRLRISRIRLAVNLEGGVIANGFFFFFCVPPTKICCCSLFFAFSSVFWSTLVCCTISLAICFCSSTMVYIYDGCLRARIIYYNDCANLSYQNEVNGQDGGCLVPGRGDTMTQASFSTKFPKFAQPLSMWLRMLCKRSSNSNLRDLFGLSGFLFRFELVA